MATFEILQAVPAAGKTAAILNHIIEEGQAAIVASISRDLNRQSYDYFKENGGKHAMIIDSDNKNGNSVSKTIESAIDRGVKVLFITHSALLNYEDFGKFAGYHLYIDEVPEVMLLERMRFTSNAYKVLQYCEDIKDPQKSVTYTLKLKEEYRDEVEKIATDGYYKADEIAEALLPVYKNLLRGYPIKYIHEGDSSYVFFIDDLSNQDWDVFSSVTIACANFYDTLTGCIIKYWSDFNFKRSQLHKKLRFDKYTNTERINIHIVSNEDWSRYTADKLTSDGKSVYDRAQETVESMFGDDYIYTTNEYRPKMNGIQIQYNPHGLNMYSDALNIVALFSYNPQPWQIPILRELATMQGLDDDELLHAYAVSKFLEPVFQLCTRGDMRNNGSTKQINLVVPDMRSAMYLKTRYMSGAKIYTDTVIDVPKKYQRKSNTAHAFLGFTKKRFPKEYVRFSNHIKRNYNKKLSELLADNPADLKLVKDWLIENNVQC